MDFKADIWQMYCVYVRASYCIKAIVFFLLLWNKSLAKPPKIKLRGITRNANTEESKVNISLSDYMCVNVIVCVYVSIRLVCGYNKVSRWFVNMTSYYTDSHSSFTSNVVKFSIILFHSYMFDKRIYDARYDIIWMKHDFLKPVEKYL